MTRGSKRRSQSEDRQGARSPFASIAARARDELGKLGGVTERIAAPVAVRHAQAARERGNLEAAFWLYGEAFDGNGEHFEIVQSYWNVALALGRVDIASPAGIWLVSHHAARGERAQAAQAWLELIGAAPDVLVPAAALVEILPALKKRHANADEEEAEALRGPMRRLMRHAVDPRNGTLHPGIALRLFEEGRTINPEAARRAAETALRSPNLHEQKRARLEQAIAPEAASRFDLYEGAPVLLDPESLVLKTNGGSELRVPFKSIEAMAVAEIAGLAERRVVVIDLVRQLRTSSDGAEPLHVVRLRSDGFEPGRLVDGPCLPGSELAAFLGELLERTQATALPDLESALGVQFARFDSLADYEREVLSVA